MLTICSENCWKRAGAGLAMGRTRDKLQEVRNRMGEMCESLKEKVEDHYDEHVGRFTAEYLYNASMRRVMSMLVHYVYFRDLGEDGKNVAWLLGYSNECAERYGRDCWDKYPCNASDSKLSELGLAFFERRDPHPTLFAPRLAIVLRGTILYYSADIIEDLRIAAELQRNTHRLQQCQSLCEQVIRSFLADRPGATLAQIAIGGHSLGAGLAFLIGKQFASQSELYIDTHCFNPPLVTYTSIVTGHAVPDNISEVSERKKLAHGSNHSELSTVWTALSPKLHLAVQQTTGNSSDGPGILASVWVRTFGREALEREWQEFVNLKGWSPHMYLNPSDWVCLQYIKYYKKRHGKANIANVVEPQGIMTRVFGKNAKYISNVVPSAELYISKLFHNNPVLAHSLKQWHKYEALEMLPGLLERVKARLLDGHQFRLSARHLAHGAHMFGQRLMSPRSPSPRQSAAAYPPLAPSDPAAVYPPPAPYPPAADSSAYAVYPPVQVADQDQSNNYGFNCYPSF